ncbi:DUF4157 domain-containing protein [Caballeronia novacaledonica]|uniref:eCIS core domain-containing protein n=1 Tax=Caballeronia novacaledonica TaxID=1544861 RepID=A0AA37IHR1_9BURK|nr:DUF4157 domain-containing protein [Caballeronia novacaledonica]GJH28929.1 hypothetical protein CBA19CS42_30455 [Caballeronia novacaledonica]
MRSRAQDFEVATKYAHARHEIASPGTSAVQLQRLLGNGAMEKLFEVPNAGAAGNIQSTVLQRAVKSVAQRLHPGVRAHMEARFKQDFGDVQVHVGSDAAIAAEALNAKAYTVGEHIVFGRGHYAPESAAGRELLAHELAHVIQQRRGGAAPSAQADSLVEAGADQAATAATQGSGSVQVTGASGVGVARQEDGSAKRKVEPKTLNVEQIVRIFQQSRSLGDFKIRLGLGPVTDAYLKEYLIAKGFSDLPSESQQVQEPYQGPSIGPLDQPYDRRHRFVKVPVDDPLQFELKEVYATPEEAEEIQAEIDRSEFLDRAFAALAAAASAGGNARPETPESAPTYEPQPGAYKPAPLPYGGLVPLKAGAVSAMRGFQNETEVAHISGGRLARNPANFNEDAPLRFLRKNGQGGAVRADLYGPNGELIVVGGPAKGGDLGLLTSRLKDLKLAAEERGVKAQSYFTNDTGADVISKAQDILGTDNVKVFKRPTYKVPPVDMP